MKYNGAALYIAVVYLFTATGNAQVATQPNSLARAKAALLRIPEADARRYRAIQDMADWKNPYLIVLRDGIDFHTSSGARRQMSVESVAGALAELPISAWPYGRVVGVQENGIVVGKPDVELIRRNLDDLMKILRAIGVKVNPVPSA